MCEDARAIDDDTISSIPCCRCRRCALVTSYTINASPRDNRDRTPILFGLTWLLSLHSIDLLICSEVLLKNMTFDRLKDVIVVARDQGRAWHICFRRSYVPLVSTSKKEFQVGLRIGFCDKWEIVIRQLPK